MRHSKFGAFSYHGFIHWQHIYLIHHRVSKCISLFFVKLEFPEANTHAFIDNLCAHHGAGGYELASNRFFVRILSNCVEHNICIKKCFGGHNIHRD